MNELIFKTRVLTDNIKLTEEGGFLTSIDFTKEDEKENENPILNRVKRELNEYFKGKRTTFSLKDFNMKTEGTAFQKKVWDELKKIPYGEVISYKELSKRVGVEKSYRACGSANGKNRFAIIVPCHRVINENGNLGGYGGGLDIKRALLKIEGINIK